MGVGKVNVGGGGGAVKKLYRLFTQLTTPNPPRYGDIWIKRATITSGAKLSVKEPYEMSNPADGQVHLKVAYVTQELNFEELTSKIDGALDSKTYLFDISALTEKTINSRFIPLFQKDVVKEYAILTKVRVYNAAGSNWEIPEAYYYNGSEWINMSHKLYSQMFNGVLMKLTRGFDIDEQLPWTANNGEIFHVDTEGRVFANRRVDNTRFEIIIYDRDLNRLGSFMLAGGTWTGAFFVTNQDQIFILRNANSQTMVNLGYNTANRHIEIYDFNGIHIKTLTMPGLGSWSPQIKAVTGDRLYLTGVMNSGTNELDADHVMNLNNLTFETFRTDRAQWKSNYLIDGDNITYVLNNSNSSVRSLHLVTRNRHTMALLETIDIRPADHILPTPIPKLDSYEMTYNLSKDGDEYTLFISAAQFNMSLIRFRLNPDKTTSKIYAVALPMPAFNAHPPTHLYSKGVSIMDDGVIYTAYKDQYISYNIKTGQRINLVNLPYATSSLLTRTYTCETVGQFQLGLG